MKLRRVAFCALVLAFVLAHTQAPLYFSNQHQYMLHGLAQAGEGHLSEDWLANTTDPTPIFTWLVKGFHSAHIDWFFQLIFALTVGSYFAALVKLFEFITRRNWYSANGLLFMAAMTAMHSGVLRLASAHWLGKDIPWYFQAGVAGQYILGPGLQPSAFGVLLLASIPLFLRGQFAGAVIWPAMAGLIHSTYLPASAMLIATYLLLLCLRRRRRLAVILGFVALLIVAPIVLYDLVRFGPTSSRVFAEAQLIIARDRIPHHAQPARWFDLIAGLQVGWMILGIILARGRTLRAIMGIPFSIGVILTLIQIATDSDFLALLFPWRISAVLMPIATAVIFSWVISRAGRVFETHQCATVGLEDSTHPTRTAASKILSVVCVIAIIALAIGGVIIMAGRFAYRMAPEELPLLEHIRLHKKPGEVYLLPVQVPKPATGATGVVSTSFTPPPKRGPDQKLIAVDLQRFRLHTGAALFVDFKSIPYRDVDVIEWRDRIRICQALYAAENWDRNVVHAPLKRYGITHVVAPAARPLRGSYLIKEFEDEHYVLYRVSL